MKGLEAFHNCSFTFSCYVIANLLVSHYYFVRGGVHIHITTQNVILMILVGKWVLRKPLWRFAVAKYWTKMKFSIKDFFSKCEQNRSLLGIWSHLLKKSLMENFIFCTVKILKYQNLTCSLSITSTLQNAPEFLIQYDPMFVAVQYNTLWNNLIPVHRKMSIPMVSDMKYPNFLRTLREFVWNVSSTWKYTLNW